MTAVFDLKNHHLFLDTFERKFVHSNFKKSPNLIPLATLFIPYKRQHKFSVIFVIETPTLESIAEKVGVSESQISRLTSEGFSTEELEKMSKEEIKELLEAIE